MTRPLQVLVAVGYLSTILVANYVTTRYGLVPVGFGLMATAGTYCAGAAFVLRDLVQDVSGRRAVVVLILAGAVLSLAVGSARIAAASAAAFLLSELADLAVYTPLRRRGYLRAAVSSNIVGSLVDTLVFLTLAGFALRQAFVGQVVGKVLVTVAVVAAVALVRLATSRRVTE